MFPYRHMNREKMMWILLLFILTSSVGGTVVLKMTQTFYQTEENNSISIRWDTENKTDLSLINLICFLSEGLKCLFYMINSVEVPEPQHQQFAGRVHLDKDALRDGRVTLHLSRVKAEDSGTYWCEMAADYDQFKRRWALMASDNFVLNASQTSVGDSDVSLEPPAPGPAAPKGEREHPHEFTELILLLTLILAVLLTVLPAVIKVFNTKPPPTDQNQDGCSGTKSSSV